MVEIGPYTPTERAFVGAAQNIAAETARNLLADAGGTSLARNLITNVDEKLTENWLSRQIGLLKSAYTET
jgi:hypothetical protein